MRLQSSILRALVAAGLFAVLAAPAWAVPVLDPPWITTPSDPKWQGGVTTSQAWEFGQNLTQPVRVNNPFGTPQTVWHNSSPETVPFPGPNGPPTNTWHVDVDGGGVTIIIPNNPPELPLKVIHLQVTSDKAPGVPVSSPAGTAVNTYIANIEFGEPSAYYTYVWDIYIHPNPPFETIDLVFPASANIEEIVIDTICTVPEPGSLALLMLGGLALLRRRRAA